MWVSGAQQTHCWPSDLPGCPHNLQAYHVECILVLLPNLLSFVGHAQPHRLRVEDWVRKAEPDYGEGIGAFNKTRTDADAYVTITKTHVGKSEGVAWNLGGKHKGAGPPSQPSSADDGSDISGAGGGGIGGVGAGSINGSEQSGLDAVSESAADEVHDDELIADWR